MNEGHPAAGRVRDPQMVRHTVMDAALKLFARQGFADTSLREISRQSGVSHPLILHHFGSKENLYRSIKRRVVEGYAQRFPSAATEADRPIHLRAELERIVTYLGENELVMKLCARTRVDDDFEAWPGEPAVFELIEQRLAVSQRLGLLRSDFDPQLISIMVVGIVLFWLENRRYFQNVLGTTDDKDYLDEAVRMIEDGLKPGRPLIARATSSVMANVDHD